MSTGKRAFTDSNVVISASLKPGSHFARLWNIPGLDILLSHYVIDEVSGHLTAPDQRARLWQLVYKSHIVSDGTHIVLPEEIDLHPKDRPILQSAIFAKADFLVTGDLRHFSHLFGSVILGTRVESTAMFKQRYLSYFTGQGQL